MDIDITDRSLALFLALARDAGNWSGTPLFGGNVGRDPADKGNLTQLKQAGLVTSWSEDDAGRRNFGGQRMPATVWVEFTDAGKRLAAEHGVAL